MKKPLIILYVLALTSSAFAQTTWNLDFGTATGTFPASGTSIEYLSNVSRSPLVEVPVPTPASSPVQIARVRIGDIAQSGLVELVNTGVTMGSGARLRSVSPTGTSSNKFSVYNNPATSNLMRLSFKIRFDAGTNGEQVFSIGNHTGTTSFYNNGSGNTTTAFASILWNLGATKHEFRFFNNSTTTATVIDAALNPVIDNFIANSDHTIEMFCNNTAAAVIYSRGGLNFTVGANKWQVWVNGTRILFATGVPDFSAGVLPSATNLNAFAFNSRNSGSQAVTFLDDINYSDFLPAPLVLPVTLTSFSAAKQSSAVQLKWNTASEQNNSHFEIQRSLDGKTFLNIGKVNGAGNSNASLDYYFTDKNPESGVNYYRLNQVDFDGKNTLSNPVSVNMGFNNLFMSVAALPNSNSINVNVSTNQASAGKLIVFNISGQKVYEKEVSLAKGNNLFPIDFLTENKGTFVVTLTNGTQRLTEKFIR